MYKYLNPLIVSRNKVQGIGSGRGMFPETPAEMCMGGGMGRGTVSTPDQLLEQHNPTCAAIVAPVKGKIHLKLCLDTILAILHPQHNTLSMACTTHLALPTSPPSTTLLCTQLTNTKYSWQNGTRCRHSVNVLWCHSHLDWLVFEPFTLTLG